MIFDKLYPILKAIKCFIPQAITHPILQVIKWPFFALALVILFYQKFLLIINTVLVSPIMSSVQPSIFIDILCLVCVVLYGMLLVHYVSKEVHLSNPQIAWSTLAFLIYAFIRLFEQDKYHFYHFKLPVLKLFAITDTAFLMIIAYVIYEWQMHIRLKNKKLPIDATKFMVDVPIEDEKDDQYDRWFHVRTLVEKLLVTDNKTTSFSIAIIGKWGAGKTSFLNGIKKEMDKEGAIIDFEFNPWLVTDTQNITTTFFENLSSRLSEFDKELKNQLLEYSRKLIKTYDNASLKPAKLLLDLLEKDQDLARQYNGINASIKRLRKKIVVRIDDVDRLSSAEVIEVLRIIRNTANFGNTIFFVAFDRSYVTNCITDKPGNDGNQYLEKIFQLEYYLPLANHAQQFAAALRDELIPYLTKEDEHMLKLLFDNYKDSNSHAQQRFSKHFSTPRDIARFINIFILNYETISNDIYLPDYILICILKLKYPELYQALYFNKYLFLVKEDLNQSNADNDANKGLKFNNNLQIPYLNDKNELQEHNKNQYLSQVVPKAELKAAIELLTQIFPSTKPGFAPVIEPAIAHKRYLSVTQTECFDRYFDFSLDNRLKQSVFEDALNQPLNVLTKKISKWAEDRIIKNDLVIKLEHLNVFTGREQFEKVVSAIVYYANIESEERMNNGFNTMNFIQKLGGDKPQENVIDAYYDGDRELFRSFVKRLFTLPNEGKALSYMQVIRREVENAVYAGTFALSGDEMLDISIPFYYRELSSAKEFDQELMFYFSSLLKNNPDNRPSGDAILMPDKRNDELREKTRQFITENDLEGFIIKFVLIEDDRNGYHYEVDKQRIKRIFSDMETFEKALTEDVSANDTIRDFRQFYEQYKAAGEKPVQFNFKHPWTGNLSLFDHQPISNTP